MMLKQEVCKQRDRWSRALGAIARECGKESRIYRMLGTIAWGRYDGEPDVTDSKDNALFGLGFLQGARYVALNVARMDNLDGERALAKIHERLKDDA